MFHVVFFFLIEELKYPLDGVDIRPVLFQNGKSPRNEFIYNIDEVQNGAAIRYSICISYTMFSRISKSTHFELKIFIHH